MTHVFVHTTDPLMHVTTELPHAGCWRYDMADGTYLFAIASSFAAATIAHLTRAATLHPGSNILPLPTVASAANVQQPVAHSVQTQVAATATPSVKATAQVAGVATGVTATAAPMTTKNVLDTIYQMTGDVAFEPSQAS